MANDLFGGLGGLMKGLSNFMPQDDPNVKLMNATNEVNDLKKQEAEIYAQIGRKAVSMHGIDSFGELSDKLKLIQSNLRSAEEKLSDMQSQKEERERAEAEKKNASTCSACGHENPENTKFCQECGTKLGGSGKAFCVSCGAELVSGTRFCGECGARQGD